MEKIDYKGALLESHIEWPESSRHFVPVAGDKKSDKKLAKCLKSYEVKDGEKVLFVLDDTVFGSATDGILFTERAIYVKKLADSPQRTAYFQIRDTSVYTEGKHDNIQMEINGVALGPFGMLDDDFLEPLEAALVHIRIATNQKINEVQQVVEAKKAGREQASAEENDQNSKICPSCSASNDEEARFCSNCACPFPRKKEKKLARCTSCDEMILADSAFCSKCGEKQEAQAFCTSCGEKLAAIAKFCGNCGNATTDGKAAGSLKTTQSSDAKGQISIGPHAIQEVTGNIDSDGDFRAEVSLSTGDFGDEGEKVFIKSRVIAELNGDRTDEADASSDYCVGDPMYLYSGYKKIDAKNGDQFSVEISLDVFKKHDSKASEFTADKFETNLGLDNASLQILSVEIDEDGIASVGYEIKSQAEQVLGVSIGLANEESDFCFMEYHEDEFEDCAYVYDASSADGLKVELMVMSLHSRNHQLLATGSVAISEPWYATWEDLEKRIQGITKEDFDFLQQVWPSDIFSPHGMVAGYMDEFGVLADEDPEGAWRRMMVVLYERYDDVAQGSDSTAAGNMMKGENTMDWSSVAERAFNWFANGYRKTEDYDEAFEMFDGEITEAMEGAGMELEHSWFVDLPDDAFETICAKALELATAGDNAGNEYGPFFTFIDTRKNERESERG